MAARAKPTSLRRSSKPKIPRSFALMGHLIKVRRLPLSRWRVADAVGYFDPQRMVIALCTASSVSAQEQTFWHEATHAMLYVMGNAKYSDEGFVDQLGGLIHQIVHTSEF